jgi:hypothetical protein
MKQQNTRRQRGRPVAWSFGAGPTSSPASSTPRCAALGLDLGLAPKARHPCRRRLALSFAGKRRSPGRMDAHQGNRRKEERVRGFAPETPPRAEPLEPFTRLDAGTGASADVPRFTIAVDATCSPLALDRIAAAKSVCGLFPCLTGGVRSTPRPVGASDSSVHRGPPFCLRAKKRLLPRSPAAGVPPASRCHAADWNICAPPPDRDSSP